MGRFRRDYVQRVVIGIADDAVRAMQYALIAELPRGIQKSAGGLERQQLAGSTPLVDGLPGDAQAFGHLSHSQRAPLGFEQLTLQLDCASARRGERVSDLPVGSPPRSTYGSNADAGTAAIAWQRDDWLLEIPSSARRGGTSVARCDRGRAASPPSCFGRVARSSPSRRSARSLISADSFCASRSIFTDETRFCLPRKALGPIPAEAGVMP
jgi:hypothetical protein